ncbi:MAG: GNAT family N-acetyltransferase [Planctomycetota bacterium]|jgi:GNAT superfamily N-acetyltransferase|nr:GNAT family N-acetyltransferase [Planctomycetota bacterium]
MPVKRRGCLIIRPITTADLDIMVVLIRELAVYENLLPQVEVDAESLRQWLFTDSKAEALLVEAEGEVVGYAIFFTTFSTFAGRPGLFLEDLFIRPDARGKGCGTAVLQYLASLAEKRGYVRLEWNCLDWNHSAHSFYQSLGAQRLHEWLPYRLSGENLTRLADGEVARPKKSGKF